MKPIRSMDEFYERFLPKTWKRIQRKRRIKEVGFGQAMAEEVLKRVKEEA